MERRTARKDRRVQNLNYFVVDRRPEADGPRSWAVWLMVNGCR